MINEIKDQIDPEDLSNEIEWVISVNITFNDNGSIKEIKIEPDTSIDDFELVDEKPLSNTSVNTFLRNLDRHFKITEKNTEDKEELKAISSDIKEINEKVKEADYIIKNPKYNQDETELQIIKMM